VCTWKFHGMACLLNQICAVAGIIQTGVFTFCPSPAWWRFDPARFTDFPLPFLKIWSSRSDLGLWNKLMSYETSHMAIYSSQSAPVGRTWVHRSGCWSTAPHAVVLTLMREHLCSVYLYMLCRLMYWCIDVLMLIYTKQLPFSRLWVH